MKFMCHHRFPNNKSQWEEPLCLVLVFISLVSRVVVSVRQPTTIDELLSTGGAAAVQKDETSELYNLIRVQAFDAIQRLLEENVDWNEKKEFCNDEDFRKKSDGHCFHFSMKKNVILPSSDKLSQMMGAVSDENSLKYKIELSRPADGELSTTKGKDSSKPPPPPSCDSTEFHPMTQHHKEKIRSPLKVLSPKFPFLTNEVKHSDVFLIKEELHLYIIRNKESKETKAVDNEFKFNKLPTSIKVMRPPQNGLMPSVNQKFTFFLNFDSSSSSKEDSVIVMNVLVRGHTKCSTTFSLINRPCLSTLQLTQNLISSSADRKRLDHNAEDLPSSKPNDAAEKGPQQQIATTMEQRKLGQIEFDIRTDELFTPGHLLALETTEGHYLVSLEIQESAPICRVQQFSLSSKLIDFCEALASPYIIYFARHDEVIPFDILTPSAQQQSEASLWKVKVVCDGDLLVYTMEIKDENDKKLTHMRFSVNEASSLIDLDATCIVTIPSVVHFHDEKLEVLLKFVYFDRNSSFIKPSRNVLESHLPVKSAIKQIEGDNQNSCLRQNNTSPSTTLESPAAKAAGQTMEKSGQFSSQASCKAPEANQKVFANSERSKEKSDHHLDSKGQQSVRQFKDSSILFPVVVPLSDVNVKGDSDIKDKATLLLQHTGTDTFYSGKGHRIPVEKANNTRNSISSETRLTKNGAQVPPFTSSALAAAQTECDVENNLQQPSFICSLPISSTSVKAAIEAKHLKSKQGRVSHGKHGQVERMSPTSTMRVREGKSSLASSSFQPQGSSQSSCLTMNPQHLVKNEQLLSLINSLQKDRKVVLEINDSKRPSKKLVVMDSSSCDGFNWIKERRSDEVSTAPTESCVQDLNFRRPINVMLKGLETASHRGPSKGESEKNCLSCQDAQKKREKKSKGQKNSTSTLSTSHTTSPPPKSRIYSVHSEDGWRPFTTSLLDSTTKRRKRSTEERPWFSGTFVEEKTSTTTTFKSSARVVLYIVLFGVSVVWVSVRRPIPIRKLLKMSSYVMTLRLTTASCVGRLIDICHRLLLRVEKVAFRLFEWLVRSQEFMILAWVRLIVTQYIQSISKILLWLICRVRSSLINCSDCFKRNGLLSCLNLLQSIWLLVNKNGKRQCQYRHVPPRLVTASPVPSNLHRLDLTSAGLSSSTKPSDSTNNNNNKVKDKTCTFYARYLKADSLEKKLYFAKVVQPPSTSSITRPPSLIASLKRLNNSPHDVPRFEMQQDKMSTVKCFLLSLRRMKWSTIHYKAFMHTSTIWLSKMCLHHCAPVFKVAFSVILFPLNVLDGIVHSTIVQWVNEILPTHLTEADIVADRLEEKLRNQSHPSCNELPNFQGRKVVTLVNGPVSQSNSSKTCKKQEKNTQQSVMNVTATKLESQRLSSSVPPTIDTAFIEIEETLKKQKKKKKPKSKSNPNKCDSKLVNCLDSELVKQKQDSPCHRSPRHSIFSDFETKGSKDSHASISTEESYDSLLSKPSADMDALLLQHASAASPKAKVMDGLRLMQKRELEIQLSLQTTTESAQITRHEQDVSDPSEKGIGKAQSIDFLDSAHKCTSAAKALARTDPVVVTKPAASSNNNGREVGLNHRSVVRNLAIDFQPKKTLNTEIAGKSEEQKARNHPQTSQIDQWPHLNASKSYVSKKEQSISECIIRTPVSMEACASADLLTFNSLKDLDEFKGDSLTKFASTDGSSPKSKSVARKSLEVNRHFTTPHDALSHYNLFESRHGGGIPQQQLLQGPPGLTRNHPQSLTNKNQLHDDHNDLSYKNRQTLPRNNVYGKDGSNYNQIDCNASWKYNSSLSACGVHHLTTSSSLFKEEEDFIDCPIDFLNRVYPQSDQSLSESRLVDDALYHTSLSDSFTCTRKQQFKSKNSDPVHNAVKNVATHQQHHDSFSDFISHLEKAFAADTSTSTAAIEFLLKMTSRDKALV